MTTPQTTPELLACPFCGNANGSQPTTHQLETAEGVCESWRTGCFKCLAFVTDDTAALSVARWNTRAATQERAAPLEGVHQNVKTWPERIWLQGNPDLEDPASYTESLDDEVTWCANCVHFGLDIEYIRADLRAPASPQPLAPPPGYALVPLEPTREMLAAGGKAKLPGQFYPGMTAEESAYANEKYYPAERLANRYRAMVASAPQPPASALPLAVGVEPTLCSVCGGGRHVAAHRPILSGPNAGEPLDHIFTVDTPANGELGGCLPRAVLIERLSFLASQSTHGPIANETYRDAARMLAASPPPPGGMVPLTPDRIKVAIDADPSALQQGTLTAFCRGVRFAERSHGITPGGIARDSGEAG